MTTGDTAKHRPRRTYPRSEQPYHVWEYVASDTMIMVDTRDNISTARSVAKRLQAEGRKASVMRCLGCYDCDVVVLKPDAADAPPPGEGNEDREWAKKILPDTGGTVGAEYRARKQAAYMAAIKPLEAEVRAGMLADYGIDIDAEEAEERRRGNGVPN